MKYVAIALVVLIMGPMLIAPFIKKPGRLRDIMWFMEGIEEPGPLGYEHYLTASSACHQGRHWNCGVRIYTGLPIPGLMGRRIDCSCPCHQETKRGSGPVREN